MRRPATLFVLLAAAAASLAVLWPMLSCCPPLRRLLGGTAGSNSSSCQSRDRPAAQAAAAQRPMAAAPAAADTRLWPTKPPFVVQPASGQHKSTVIMLHGLVSLQPLAAAAQAWSLRQGVSCDAGFSASAGHAALALHMSCEDLEHSAPQLQGDSGIGWAFLPKLLAEDLPHTQWVLPNAPVVRPTGWPAALAMHACLPRLPCVAAQHAQLWVLVLPCSVLAKHRRTAAASVLLPVQRRISRFGGQSSTAWFDIMPAAGADTQQDAVGMKDTLRSVNCFCG